jgi:glycosyltransferase involved in cell wall biosynthesis
MKTREHIVAITSFPPKGLVHDKHVVGIASYAKNTFRAIQKAINTEKKLSLSVLAEKLPDAESYTENKIEVKRLWKRGSFLTFPLLLKEIFKYQKGAKIVLIEFELSMFGGLLSLIPFPLFLLSLKIINKKIIFVLHQVIPDMEDIAPHINLKHKSFKTGIYNGLLRVFYSFVLLFSSKIIVFEQDFRERMQKIATLGQNSKIVVIPHGVEEFKRVPTKDEARRKLGLPRAAFVILSFGYLAWYKGTDWLVQAIYEIKRRNGLKSNDIQLILAGGTNPNHADKEHYQKYIRGLIRECRKPGFTLTGFVPEKDIPLYFKACDLVVLPYRTFMSSSGPLSITFSFKKPFLLSPKLRGVLDASDVKELLNQLKLKKEDLIFRDFNSDFGKKLLKLRKNPRLLNKIMKFSGGLSEKRSWEKIGQRYCEELLN